VTEVRENLKGKNFSFTEIAKATGERWQVLPVEERTLHESKSKAMKDRYHAQLAEYKKTRQYAEYQEYLVDFRTKDEELSSGKARVLASDVTKPTSRKDSKRKRDDQQNSSSRHSDRGWNAGRLDSRDTTTQSSERQHGDQYRAVLEPSRKLARVNRRTCIMTDNSSPEYLPSIHLDTPALPLCHTKGALTSINAPQLQDSRPGSKRSRNDNPDAPPPYTQYDHPTSTSIKLAYGSTPGLNSKPATTTSDTFSRGQQTYIGPMTSPAFWRLHSTAFSNCAKAPDAASTPNVLGASTRRFPNSHLLPCIPSRLASSRPGATTLEGPALPKRPLFAILPSGFATLLHASEHLASQESRSHT
jgi:hypothetical protein